MINIVIDYDSKIRIVLGNYVKAQFNVNIIDYTEINEDFVLVKSIEKETDLDVIKKLNNSSYKYDLISVIADEKYVLDLLDLHKTYFIKKDKLKENLAIIDECIKNFSNSKTNNIDIISNYEHIIINTQSIIYIESYMRDVIIYTSSGKFKSRKKISTLYQELECFGFIQIHKSYLVNDKYIDYVTTQEMVLSNQVILPIGRKFKDEVKKYLMERK